jgi:all-trans-8'-apo-beta-carotenal 15,15'-oxygenase
MITAVLRPPAATPAPSAHLWHRAFSDLPREHGFEPLRIEGRIPGGLAGTLYRSGPSLFSTFGRRYAHWFDGDGAVSAFRFDVAGGVTGAVKLVQSRGLLEERRRGRPHYAAYGTPAPSAWRGLVSGLTRDIKNTGNTSVMIWQGRLYALVESSPPTELSTEDLATLGERDLDGALVQNISAHLHHVPARHAAYNFGVRYGRRVELDLYELPDAGAARRLHTITLAGGTMIHDFIATERHLVIFAPPLRLRMLRMLVGIGSYSDNLRWRPEEGTEVLVIPIDAPTQVQRFTVPAFYQWHFATAFEREREIVVDYVRYADFASNRWLGDVVSGPAHSTLGGRLHRAVLDPARGTLVDEERAPAVIEFPRVATSASDNRHVYAAAYASDQAARGMFDAVARIDVPSGDVTLAPIGPDRYPSEPVFVRRPGSGADDDGWLLTLIYDGTRHQSGVAVLDSRELERGPIAIAWLDHHVPFTFHGNFARA